ncbi:hypothetical protein SAMN04488128_102636 [Chitinophaga eiseniae]|uniref:Cell shape-determining protein MreB n=1 Tax=Chitinophaga eiseniae TaxID=634771 RepID=A0A1T4QX01_9BACT|nr:hypothetical protein [Chitinophaga eiseniae]SKA08185.1 hypothetical protein SAMN04488128_102636 [Chitinophaga eiseniae]
MNKNYVLALMAAATTFAACSKNDDNNTTPPPSGNSDTVMVRGKITANQTWSKNKTYVLRGYVYVDNATLNIEAGTKIISMRDSAGVLLIYKGAQIQANGTAENPIVFTSGHTEKKPGDLGGVILVGKAIGNGNHAKLEGNIDAAYSAFGGTQDDDNSGSMQYVRIEYAGKAVAANDEINGLSLYCVGNKTTLNHIQVVNGLDDAYEFFGGSVNAKYLIAYNCADDDFDMDDAYHGMIQFAVSVKQPSFTDKKSDGDVSNNFEVDNTNPKNLPITTTPTTFPILSNFTAIGPNNAAGTSADYGYGMRWRRGAKFVLGNSIIMGAKKAALRIDDNVTLGFYADATSGLKNSLLHGTTDLFATADGSGTVVLDAAGLQNLVTGRDATKVFAAANAGDIKLKDPFNNKTPDLAPQTGSPAIANDPAKFDGKLADAFFEKVKFLGAVDPANDWTKAKWVAWDRIVVTQ